MRSKKRTVVVAHTPACESEALLAIDPGLGGTGWALFAKGRSVPYQTGVIHCRKATWAWWARANAIAMDLGNTVGIGWHDHAMVVSEFPMQMQSAAGIATQKDSGIYKLAFLVGLIRAEFKYAAFRPVTPQEWKGQLPKDVVIHRIRRSLGLKATQHLGIKTHAWDAVGIGLWARGNKEFWR